MTSATVRSPIAEEDDPDVCAIISLLERESSAFWEKDYEAYASCWLHSSCSRRVGWWSLGGVTYRCGWDEIGERARAQFQLNPAPNPSATLLHRENFQFG